MDATSIIGLGLGLAALLLGSMAEGGGASTILQGTAAVIVFGGTLGATLLSCRPEDVLRAVASLKGVFIGRRPDLEAGIAQILRFSILARKRGLIAIEPEIHRLSSVFFRRTLRLAVDGASPAVLRQTMQQASLTFEDQGRRTAKVFETAGGFAPTIGIIGAVLGLIHVMRNLADPSMLGTGIAVAFVATVYGVASANLLLLPISKKLLSRLNDELHMREMILEGVLGIQTGLNPNYLEERLKVFLPDSEGD